MKNPCQTCDRALLDKNECSLGCERRHEYCVHLGISVHRETPEPCNWEDLNPPQPLDLSKAPRPPKPPRPPNPPYDWHAPRGMRSKGGRLEKATVLMKEGKGNREISRLTGMNKTTAAKLRRVLEGQGGGPFFCACGKPATHQGWCPYRFVKSPKRQAMILKFSLGKDTPSKLPR